MASRKFILACICNHAYDLCLWNKDGIYFKCAYDYLLVVDSQISLTALPDVLHVLFCLSRSSRDLTSLIDWLICGCLNAGSARVKPTSPVTVRPGRCGWRKLLKWNQRNVSTDLVSLSPHMDGDLKYLLMRINQTKCLCSGRVSLSLCSLPALPALWPVAGVSEAYEDAANCLWLLSNAKPCANCKSPIQKNEGCNHMQCAKVISLITCHVTQSLLRNLSCFMQVYSLVCKPATY